MTAATDEGLVSESIPGHDRVDIPAAPADHAPLVLVVEDDRDMNAFVAEQVARSGLRVAVAFDGTQGYDKAISLRPDLVVTDILMPDASGDVLIAKLRQHPELARVPIVVLSAKADDELRIRLLRLGVQDWLAKPFSCEELDARIGNLLARKRADEHNIALQRQVDDMTDASNEVTQAISSLPTSSVRAVLQTIVLKAQSLTNAEFAAVGLSRGRDLPFDPWVSVGIDPERGSKIGPPGLAELLRLVGDAEHATRLRDLRSHPAFRGFAPHPVMTSYLGVPISYRGNSVGNLYLTNKRGATEFTDHDQRLVEMLAARVGAAIEIARLYNTEGLERAWLPMVVDQLPEAVVLMDARGQVTTQNRAALSLATTTHDHDPFGNPITLDLRRPNGERLAPDELPNVRAILHQESTYGMGLVAVRADGRLAPVQVSASPLWDSEGRLAGATMVLQDIAMLTELERLRGEWASIIAHDLQQPINAIVLNTDLLLRGEPREVDRVRIERVRSLAAQLSRMANDLTDASLLETQRLAIVSARVELGPLVDFVVQRVPGAIERTIVHAGTTRLFVHADAGRVEQVLSNLLSNAMKYGAPDAQVRIDLALDTTEGAARISVTNRGPGIPAADIPLVFERFVRTRTARDSAIKGSGLGLYIARGLVEAHGGRLWVESVPDETTTFAFTIPLDTGPGDIPIPIDPRREISQDRV